MYICIDYLLQIIDENSFDMELVSLVFGLFIDLCLQETLAINVPSFEEAKTNQVALSVDFWRPIRIRFCRDLVKFIVRSKIFKSESKSQISSIKLNALSTILNRISWIADQSSRRESHLKLGNVFHELFLYSVSLYCCLAQNLSFAPQALVLCRYLSYSLRLHEQKTEQQSEESGSSMDWEVVYHVCAAFALPQAGMASDVHTLGFFLLMEVFSVALKSSILPVMKACVNAIVTMATSGIVVDNVVTENNALESVVTNIFPIVASRFGNDSSAATPVAKLASLFLNQICESPCVRQYLVRRGLLDTFEASLLTRSLSSDDKNTDILTDYFNGLAILSRDANLRLTLRVDRNLLSRLLPFACAKTKSSLLLDLCFEIIANYCEDATALREMSQVRLDDDLAVVRLLKNALVSLQSNRLRHLAIHVLCRVMACREVCNVFFFHPYFMHLVGEYMPHCQASGEEDTDKLVNSVRQFLEFRSPSDFIQTNVIFSLCRPASSRMKQTRQSSTCICKRINAWLRSHLVNRLKNQVSGYDWNDLNTVYFLVYSLDYRKSLVSCYPLLDRFFGLLSSTELQKALDASLIIEFITQSIPTLQDWQFIIRQDVIQRVESERSDDVQISVTDRNGVEKIFAASRHLLSSASPVFRAMFNRSFRESNASSISLFEVDHVAFTELLRSLQWDPIRLDDDVAAFIELPVLVELFWVADTYFMFSLRDSCVKAVSARIQSSVSDDELLLVFSWIADLQYLDVVNKDDLMSTEFYRFLVDQVVYLLGNRMTLVVDRELAKSLLLVSIDVLQELFLEYWK